MMTVEVRRKLTRTIVVACLMVAMVTTDAGTSLYSTRPGKEEAYGHQQDQDPRYHSAHGRVYDEHSEVDVSDDETGSPLHMMIGRGVLYVADMMRDSTLFVGVLERAEARATPRRLSADSTDNDDSCTSVACLSMSWQSVKGSLRFTGGCFFAILLVFELVRKQFWWIYEARTGHPKYTKDTPPAPRWYPFDWYSILMSESLNNDEKIFEKYGTDVLVLLKFLRFCIQSTTFASVMGCGVLVPIYYFAGDNSENLGDGESQLFTGFSATTMSKILQNKGELWFPTIVAYVMTAHTIFLLNRFYQQFILLRNRYIVTRASGIHVVGSNTYTAMQEALTVKIENIPHKYQTREKLQAHFEELFPNDQIYSAVMMLRDTGELTRLLEQFKFIERNIEAADLARQQKLGTKREIQQCVWFCGQPDRCLCCCIGQPNSCTCCLRTCPGLYTLSDPVLNLARQSTLDRMRATYHEKVEPQIIKAEPTPASTVTSRSRSKPKGRKSKERMRTLYHHGGDPFEAEDGLETATSASSASLSGVEEGSLTNFDQDSDEEDDESDELPNPNDVGGARHRHQKNMGGILRGIRDLTSKGGDDASRDRDSLETSELDKIRHEGMVRLDVDINRRDETGRLNVPSRKRGGMTAQKPLEMLQHAKAGQKSEKVEAALEYSNERSRTANASTPSTRSPFWDTISMNGRSAKENFVQSRASNHKTIRARADTFNQEVELGALKRGQWFLCHILAVLGKMISTLVEDAIKLCRSVLTVLNDLYIGIKTERSSTGFVTFKSHVALSSAIQVRLSREPFTMVASAAPELRDVLFANVAVPSRRIQYRIYFSGFLLALGALLWSALVGTVSNLPAVLKGLFNENFVDSKQYDFIVQKVPVLCLLSILNLLPLLFTLHARFYEQRKSMSEVDLSVVRRFFDYQMANTYVTLMTSTIIESASAAIFASVSNPKTIAELVGTHVATSGHYFMNFLIIKLGTSPMWLLRLWPLISRGVPEPKIPAEVPSVPYGWALPKLLLTLLVAHTYMIIAPLCVPVALAIFIVHNWFFKYLIVWNHMPHYESGGMFWYMTFHRIVLGLILSNCFVILAVYLKTDAPHAQAVIMMPLPFACYAFGEYARHAYEIPSKSPARYDSVEQDKMINRAMMRFDFNLFDHFNEFLYAQPSVQHSIQFEKQHAMANERTNRGRGAVLETPKWTSGVGVAGITGSASQVEDELAAPLEGVGGARVRGLGGEGAELKRPSGVSRKPSAEEIQRLHSSSIPASMRSVGFSDDTPTSAEEPGSGPKLRPPSVDGNSESPRSTRAQKFGTNASGGKLVPVRSLSRRAGGRNASREIDAPDPPTVQL